MCPSKCSSSILACWKSSGEEKLNCVTRSVEHRDGGNFFLYVWPDPDVSVF